MKIMKSNEQEARILLDLRELRREHNAVEVTQTNYRDQLRCINIAGLERLQIFNRDGWENVDIVEPKKKMVRSRKKVLVAGGAR